MPVSNEEAHEITRLAVELDTLRLRAWSIPQRQGNTPEAKALRATLARAELALDEAVTRLKEKQLPPSTSSPSPSASGGST